MTPYDFNNLAKAIIRMQQLLHGCSNGWCIIKGSAQGVHTNGGCHCLRNIEEAALHLAEEAEAARGKGQIQLPIKENDPFGIMSFLFPSPDPENDRQS